METIFIGREKLTLDETTSTNAFIKQLNGEKVRAEGFTITAEYQTSGRGQFGNSWESAKGQNLLVSLLLRPKFLSPERQFLLNMSVCLAIYDSLNELLPGFQVKWPNDILYDGKKVGGILIENSIIGTDLDTSVIGFGINVNQNSFEDNLRRTSLYKLLGNEVNRDYLLSNILKEIEIRYLKLKSNNISKLYNEYYSALYGYKQEVSVVFESEKTQMKIIGVEPSGQLNADVKGVLRRFDFKEVKFLLP